MTSWCRKYTNQDKQRAVSGINVHRLDLLILLWLPDRWSSDETGLCFQTGEQVRCAENIWLSFNAVICCQSSHEIFCAAFFQMLMWFRWLKTTTVIQAIPNGFLALTSDHISNEKLIPVILMFPVLRKFEKKDRKKLETVSLAVMLKHTLLHFYPGTHYSINNGGSCPTS